MTNYKITAESLIKQTMTMKRKRMESATNALFLAVRMYSPVRTGTYIGSHRNMGVRQDEFRLIWEVTNEWPYPERVEYGFWKGGRIGGRLTSVRWHLLNGQIYVDKGSHTYQKALLQIKDQFLKSV